MPLQQLQFQTSAFTGTTQRETVGQGLAKLVATSLTGYAKVKTDEQKYKDAEETRRLRKESIEESRLNKESTIVFNDIKLEASNMDREFYESNPNPTSDELEEHNNKIIKLQAEKRAMLNDRHNTEYGLYHDKRSIDVSKLRHKENEKADGDFIYAMTPQIESMQDVDDIVDILNTDKYKKKDILESYYKYKKESLKSLKDDMYSKSELKEMFGTMLSDTSDSRYTSDVKKEIESRHGKYLARIKDDEFTMFADKQFGDRKDLRYASLRKLSNKHDMNLLEGMAYLDDISKKAIEQKHKIAIDVGTEETFNDVIDYAIRNKVVYKPMETDLKNIFDISKTNPSSAFRLFKVGVKADKNKYTFNDKKAYQNMEDIIAYGKMYKEDVYTEAGFNNIVALINDGSIDLKTNSFKNKSGFGTKKQIEERNEVFENYEMESNGWLAKKLSGEYQSAVFKLGSGIDFESFVESRMDAIKSGEYGKSVFALKDDGIIFKDGIENTIVDYDGTGITRENKDKFVENFENNLDDILSLIGEKDNRVLGMDKIELVSVNNVGNNIVFGYKGDDGVVKPKSFSKKQLNTIMQSIELEDIADEIEKEMYPNNNNEFKGFRLSQYTPTGDSATERTGKFVMGIGKVALSPLYPIAYVHGKYKDALNWLGRKITKRRLYNIDSRLTKEQVDNAIDTFYSKINNGEELISLDDIVKDIKSKKQKDDNASKELEDIMSEEIPDVKKEEQIKSTVDRLTNLKESGYLDDQEIVLIDKKVGKVQMYGKGDVPSSLTKSVITYEQYIKRFK